jgi:hypothetical protein
MADEKATVTTTNARERVVVSAAEFAALERAIQTMTTTFARLDAALKQQEVMIARNHVSTLDKVVEVLQLIKTSDVRNDRLEQELAELKDQIRELRRDK